MLWSGCYLRIGVIGISYKTADLSLREEFARVAEKISGERALFFKHPTILLSTCNRTEIYFSAEDLAEAHSDLFSFFRSSIKEAFEHRLYAYFGIDCFIHLSRVISGLDSAILAETEIQAQVKLAYMRASLTLALPKCVHYVFQKSLRVAKITRNALLLEKGAASLYGTLWRLSQEHFDDLKRKRILLVGYSEINRAIGTFFSRRGAENIFLATRAKVSVENVIRLGRECLEFWQDFDLIVCATKSDRYLIEGAGDGHQLIFDLSVPRNVDPALLKATLWNIEQLNKIVEQNRRLAEEGLERGELLVEESVYRFAKLFRAKEERTKGLLA